MATERQINANRLNAQKSTGPTTQAGRDKSRFNHLIHGIRAQSVLLPGEVAEDFTLHRDALVASVNPQDEMEKSFVEQIAASQWKLSRLDRAEDRIHKDNSLDSLAFVKALNTLSLIQSRLQRDISQALRDLERYRAIRLQRHKDKEENKGYSISEGMLEHDNEGHPYYHVLPLIKGLDGKFRTIPRDVMGDFCGRPRYERGAVGPDGPVEPIPGYDHPDDCTGGDPIYPPLKPRKKQD